jgi:hypothetical protein
MNTLNKLEFFAPSLRHTDTYIQKLEAEYENVVKELKTSDKNDELHSHIQELQKITQESLKRTQMEYSYLEDKIYEDAVNNLHHIYSAYITRIQILLEEFDVIERHYSMDSQNKQIEDSIKMKRSPNMH